MKRPLTSYQRIGFLGILITALGVVLSTTMEEVRSLGTVFIAIGGLFFVIAMSRKKKEEEEGE